MFYYQNSALGPNLLAASVEEEEEHNCKRRNRMFRDVGNEQPQRSKTDIISAKPTWQSAAKEDEQREGEGEGKLQEEMRKMFANKKTNVIMQFSSDEEEDADKPTSEPTSRKPEKQEEECPKAEKIHEQSREVIQVPKKNKFLLAFSDDQKSEEEIPQNEPEAEKQNITSPQYPQKNNKNNLILNFQSDSQEESQSRPSMESLPSQKNNKNTLLTLLNKAKDKFYLEPIDESMTLQCLIKRQRTNTAIKYQIHDSATLRNIMTVEKTDDGYLLISKYAQLSCSGPPNKGDIVVGRLLSNFFGTEFNCYLWSYPFKKFAEYTVDPDKSKQTITIEYETNIFGLKGPRKMTSYIPIPPSNSISDGIVSKKRLNQLYEKQQKKKMAPTVQKFRNKTPKWNSSIDAYVLNFYGRATVSSIKNFIMIKEEEADDAEPRLLFGKFGKDLFNLDLRHPFNLLQGVALALSSFDKKLACE